MIDSMLRLWENNVGITPETEPKVAKVCSCFL